MLQKWKIDYLTKKIAAEMVPNCMLKSEKRTTTKQKK